MTGEQRTAFARFRAIASPLRLRGLTDDQLRIVEGGIEANGPLASDGRGAEAPDVASRRRVS